MKTSSILRIADFYGLACRLTAAILGCYVVLSQPATAQTAAPTVSPLAERNKRQHHFPYLQTASTNSKLEKLSRFAFT